MAADLSVNISGSLLSSLFYEHLNGQGDQEGFLLGEVISHITDTISDSQICSEKEETSLNIYTIVPCEKPFSFYDSSGAIKQQALDYILQGRHKEVLGWYKFRRNTSLEVSLREQNVHTNLSHILVSTYEKFFIFGLFTNYLSSNEATHSFDHVFLRNTGMCFESVPLKVINLGGTSHSEYRLYPPAAINIHSGHYSQVIHSSRLASNVCDVSVRQIQQVHSALQSKLEALQEQVGDGEAIVAAMTFEVSELQARLASLQAAKDCMKEVHKEIEHKSPMGQQYEEMAENCNLVKETKDDKESQTPSDIEIPLQEVIISKDVDIHKMSELKDNKLENMPVT